MANLNRVSLIGNTTRDPELNHTQSGTAVLDLGIAVNRKWNDSEGKQCDETTFIDITFWAKQAEIIAQYVRKGKPLYVEGRLQMDQWEDKATGQNRTKLKVIGEAFQFLGSKGETNAPHVVGNQPQRSAAQPTDQSGIDHDESRFSDGIPF
jgi:single-strand DNA-binding protein